MLSKAQIKYIRSLTLQKYRKEYNVFIAEGDKVAREWLNSNAPIRYIVALEDWVKENKLLIAKHKEAQLAIVTPQILSSVAALKTPNKVLLVVEKPEKKEQLPNSEWTIALDNIQDPGNMGTIIRIADWFGISNIVCSPDCVDVYNPKVVQAAMGGHLRVSFFESPLLSFLRQTTVPALAATLDGHNLYDCTPFSEGVLLIGNESKGLDKRLVEASTHCVTIPRKGGAESLNAAVSAGIICSHLIR